MLTKSIERQFFYTHYFFRLIVISLHFAQPSLRTDLRISHSCENDANGLTECGESKGKEVSFPLLGTIRRLANYAKREKLPGSLIVRLSV